MGDIGNKLAWNLLKGLNLWSILLFVYKNSGKDAVARFLTPPESFVRLVTTATGADLSAALEERKEAVEETLEFLEALVDKDFTDPDDAEVL
jgi:hypothetical protein